jgi:hypothetical protein
MQRVFVLLKGGAPAFAAVFLLGLASVGYRNVDGKSDRPAIVPFGGTFYLRRVAVVAPKAPGFYPHEINNVVSALTPIRLNRILAEQNAGSYASALEGDFPVDVIITMGCDYHQNDRTVGERLDRLSLGVLPGVMTSDYVFMSTCIKSESALERVLSRSSQRVQIQRKGWQSIIPLYCLIATRYYWLR